MRAYVTNTQFAELMREVRAIRASVERSESLAVALSAPQAADDPNVAAQRVINSEELHSAAIAEAFETEARELAASAKRAAQTLSLRVHQPAAPATPARGKRRGK